MSGEVRGGDQTKPARHALQNSECPPSVSTEISGEHGGFYFFRSAWFHREALVQNLVATIIATGCGKLRTALRVGVNTPAVG